MDVKRYKAGKLKGELTTAEIRKLIRAHNKASSIKIPPKSTREDIVGILKKAGYMVNHQKAELRPLSKGKVQKLKVISQQTIQKELPKPKTKLEKQKAKEEKEEKQMQKKKQERAERKAIVQKALKQQEKTISKKKDKEKILKKEVSNKTKKKMPDASTQTEPQKKEPKKDEFPSDLRRAIVDMFTYYYNNFFDDKQGTASAKKFQAKIQQIETGSGTPKITKSQLDKVGSYWLDNFQGATDLDEYEKRDLELLLPYLKKRGIEL